MEEGEKRGIFSQQRLPPHILASIVHHNLELYRNRSLYHQHYYDFVLGLCSEAVAQGGLGSSGYLHQLSVDEGEREGASKEEVKAGHMQVTRLALSFFFNTYLRLKSKSDAMLVSWCGAVESLVQQSQAACLAAMQFFSAEEGGRHLQPMLLHAPEKMQREACRTVLTAVLEQAVLLMGNEEEVEREIERLLTIFLGLLRDAVPASVHTSQLYFNVLHAFCCLGKAHCHLVLSVRGFSLMIQFLLGRDPEDPTPTTQTLNSSHNNCNNNNNEPPPPATPLDTDRRWTSLQSQELGLLHASCAELILSCDLSSLATAPSDDESNVSMTSVEQLSPRPDASSSRLSGSSRPDPGEDSVTIDALLPMTVEKGELGMEKETSKLSERALKRPASPVKMEVSQSPAGVPCSTLPSTANLNDSRSKTFSGNSTAATVGGDDSTTDPLKSKNSRGFASLEMSGGGGSSDSVTGVENDCVKALRFSDTASSTYNNNSSGTASSACIPPPRSVAVLLSGGTVSLQWLAVVVTAYTELVEHMPQMTGALMAGCRGNGPFSRAFLATVLSQYGSAPTHTLRELSHLIMEALRIQDTLHGERVAAVLEGCTDSHGNHHKGLLDLIINHYNGDVRRAYQCMKLCVGISGRFPHARDVLAGTSERWRIAVTWLTDTLHRSFEAPSTGHSYTAPLSNEGTHTSVFQRTTSAQMTLEEATTLLGQMEPLDMETESTGGGDGLVDIREDSPSPPF